jgi:hypothetical protein
MSRREKCHTDCEKYLAYRERLAEQHKAQAKEREVNVFSIRKKYKADKVKQSFQK